MSEAEVSQVTFEEKMAAVENLISEMESGKMTLNDSVAAYEKGAKMLREMEKELDCAQQRLTVLTAAGEEPMEPGEER